MSNPAVFELAKTNIAAQEICIEDNIGESIHLHIGLIRIDMTVKEFQQVTTTMQNALNTLTPNFLEINQLDPYFLERLSDDILNITGIDERTLPLADLKTCFEGDDGEIFTVNLTESPAFKYYSGEPINLEQFENRGNICQSNQERADKVFESVKHGKAFKIYIDEDKKILDGCLSAAAMARLHGANKRITVNILRFKSLKASTISRQRRKKLW